MGFCLLFRNSYIHFGKEHMKQVQLCVATCYKNLIVKSYFTRFDLH